MDFLSSHIHFAKTINLAPYVYYYFENEEEHGYIAMPKTIHYPVFYAFYVKSQSSPLSSWFESLVNESFSRIEKRDRIKKLLL